MSPLKILASMASVIFAVIFAAAYFKGEPANNEKVVASQPVEVELQKEIRPVKEVKAVAAPPQVTVEAPKPEPKKIEPKSALPDAPEVNRIEDLFVKNSPLKFIETLTYKSRVSWQKGRPAWLSDYASQYETSRHFIARSLNGKSDYFKQEIQEGDKFNAFKKDVKLSFHMVIDASLCKMWLFAIDDTNHEKTLLKTYQVCLGRPDSSKTSGLLTPLGTFSLGSRVAIYKPKVSGFHNGKKIEMVRVFGSRWIPFDKEIANTTAPAKGFGLHGVPWVENKKGELVQDKNSLGKYESDGCIRCATDDMEEIFAIVITKPTVVEIVKNYNESSLFKTIK